MSQGFGSTSGCCCREADLMDPVEETWRQPSTYTRRVSTFMLDVRHKMERRKSFQVLTINSLNQSRQDVEERDTPDIPCDKHKNLNSGIVCKRCNLRLPALRGAVYETINTRLVLSLYTCSRVIVKHNRCEDTHTG
ncbi:unnamed protein product [Pleuronectes platessa]|uniref:Uncharacterized protein n=1 Tax=Pleuronectes platessa TaxID=8262 RepID=A0A9N7YWD8_PLEPL|nr:unnamed protein product [Pleuronectes platessa]